MKINRKMDPGEKWHDYVQLLQLLAELLYQKIPTNLFKPLVFVLNTKAWLLSPSIVILLVFFRQKYSSSKTQRRVLGSDCPRERESWCHDHKLPWPKDNEKNIKHINNLQRWKFYIRKLYQTSFIYLLNILYQKQKVYNDTI